MRRWRVAVVGAAGFAKAKHLPAYRTMPEIELVACCDLRAEVLEQTCDEFGIPGRYTDLDELLTRERPEVVAVVVPPPWHIPLARQCVEAGCHVLVEKPLSEDWQEVLDFRDYLAGRAEKVMVSQNYRWQNPALAMADALADDAVGDPYSMELTIYNPQAHPAEPRHYRSLFVNIGVHLVDLARRFAGREAETVYAPPIAPPHAPSVALPFIDVNIGFEGGLTALCRMDWSARGLEEWIKLRVQGSGGVAVCDYGQSPDVYVERPGEASRTYHRDDPPDSLPRVMRHLLDCIEHDRQPETWVGDNLKTVQIVLAAYQSCRENQVIRLAPA